MENIYNHGGFSSVPSASSLSPSKLGLPLLQAVEGFLEGKRGPQKGTARPHCDASSKPAPPVPHVKRCPQLSEHLFVHLINQVTII